MSEELLKIRQLIEGKCVVSVGGHDNDLLTLDDGTVLRLYESASDCCASARGSWVIEPDALDAIITDVKIDVVQGQDNGDGSESTATITILHNQNSVALGDCYANDGNGGYYFSVLSLSVELPDSDAVSVQVVDA